MRTKEIQERIAEYLAEVEAHLQAMGTEERRETLRGIEEHLWEALRARAGEAPTLADAEAVIAEAAAPSSYGSALAAARDRPRLVGWLALAALAAAVVLPLLAVVAVNLFHWQASIAAILLFLGAPFALAALVLGIVAWKTPMGKAAVIGVVVLGLAAAWFVPVSRTTDGTPAPVEQGEPAGQ
jgi:uncharacterized membrane protein